MLKRTRLRIEALESEVESLRLALSRPIKIDLPPVDEMSWDDLANQGTKPAFWQAVQVQFMGTLLAAFFLALVAVTARVGYSAEVRFWIAIIVVDVIVITGVYMLAGFVVVKIWRLLGRFLRIQFIKVALIIPVGFAVWAGVAYPTTIFLKFAIVQIASWQGYQVPCTVMKIQVC